MNARSASPSTPDATSILVYGDDRRADAALVAALALRRHGRFAWADCAQDDRSAGRSALPLLGPVAGPPSVRSVDPTTLRSRSVDRRSLRHLLAPARGPEAVRLEEHLALPPLFQTLGAHAVGADGRGAIVLLNVDLLPGDSRAEALELERTHRTLHQEGLTLLVTSVPAPTDGLRSAFARVLRLEPPDEPAGSEATLEEESLLPDRWLAGPTPLAEVWHRLGLEPRLHPRSRARGP